MDSVFSLFLTLRVAKFCVMLRWAFWLTEVAITFAESQVGVFWEVGSKYLFIGLFCNFNLLERGFLFGKVVWITIPKKSHSEGRRTINPSPHTAPYCQLFPQAGCSNPLEQSLYLIDQVNGTLQSESTASWE